MTDTKTTEEYGDLIGEVKSHLCAHLKESITDMLDSSDKELFEMSSKATNNEDQTRAFELMKQLRNIRDILAKNFIKKSSEYFKPYTESSISLKSSSVASEELSLVAQSEMEDMVLIKSMGTQAASAFREKLSHLEKRLEYLALKTPDVFEKTALNPVNFCQAFNDSLGIIFDLRSKKILFKLFEKHIISKLGAAYDDVNQLMIDAGVLPRIKLSGDNIGSSKAKPNKPAFENKSNNEQGYDVDDEFRQNSSTGTSGGHYESNDSAPQPGRTSSGQHSVTQNSGVAPSGNQASSSTNQQTHGGAVMAATPGMSPYSDPNSPRYVGGAGSRDSAGNTGGVSGGTGSGNAGGVSGGTGDGNSYAPNTASTGHQSNYKHQTAGMPASQIDNILSDYFGAPISGGVPSSEDTSSVASQTAGSSQHLGHSEILTALSKVQQQPEFINPTNLKFDSNAIKQAVISTIAKQSGGVVTKRLNQIAEKTIHFIEMIFDAIIDDDNISDTIKALLLRLQIPVIKASMLDQEFFIYDDHPARVLLDKISETGADVTTRDNEIYIVLDKIVHKLVSDYDLDTSTFQNALDALNIYIGRQERIAREKEEAEQQKVLKEHARKTVLKTLRSVTKNKRLPESVHALILRRWPTLLFNHYIDYGKENDAWIQIVEILRDIIESIQPPENAKDLARIKSTRAGLSKLAREYLSRTNQSKKDLDSVISDLESTYDAIEARANFAEEQVETAIEEIKNEVPQEKPSLPTVEESPRQVLPPNIMTGMWFKVYTGADTRPRRCKLSVIIIEDSNLVFVNYAGEVIIEKSFDEFSEELENYQSKIIMGHSIFDHALRSVITNIQSK